jgi:hypothetical protein
VQQMSLLDPGIPLCQELDKAVDTIRRRFGFNAIRLPGEK